MVSKTTADARVLHNIPNFFISLGLIGQKRRNRVYLLHLAGTMNLVGKGKVKVAASIT
jgi:hypothetical protein